MTGNEAIIDRKMAGKPGDNKTDQKFQGGNK